MSLLNDPTIQSPLRIFIISLNTTRRTINQTIRDQTDAVFPILEWGRKYNLTKFRGDLIAGLTIASLCIPQDIGYAKLANLDPQYGLYSSFVPPLVYAEWAALGDSLLGFLIDFLSHAAVVGFMGGAAITISLQQLKGFLGIKKFTKNSDIVSVIKSVWSSAHHGV
ncbi:hypothetical protein Leryth_023899 [Lithospermum erythrorhizon]|nr:hypothetical protein Leryth_023899 [Lithospermum erythrorhizon]